MDIGFGIKVPRTEWGDMDAAGYNTAVQEKLRAYDFSESDEPQISTPVFYKTEESLLSDRQKLVVIEELSEASVDSIKEALLRLKERAPKLFHNQFGFSDAPRQFYILLLPPESTSAIQVATKRAAESPDDSDYFFLPILVDLEHERLSYDKPSLTSHLEHRRMVSNIDDYFRI